jgi:hypothetical protein
MKSTTTFSKLPIDKIRVEQQRFLPYTRGIRQAWASPGGPVWTVGVARQVMLIVDGGPKVVSLVVDGILWDGGPQSNAGWGVFEYSLGQVTSATSSWSAMPVGGAKGTLHRLRVYPRALRTADAISNYQNDTRALASRSM